MMVIWLRASSSSFAPFSCKRTLECAGHTSSGISVPTSWIVSFFFGSSFAAAKIASSYLKEMPPSENVFSAAESGTMAQRPSRAAAETDRIRSAYQRQQLAQKLGNLDALLRAV